MAMSGIPVWLFASAMVVLTVVTLTVPALLETRLTVPGNPHYPTLDLLRLPGAKRLLAWRPFQFVARLPFVFLFVAVILVGLLGAQTGGNNGAAVLTWTIWWAALILFILFFGKIWCLFCPWNAIAEWVQRLTWWGKRDITSSLGLRWPRKLRNIYLATGLFVGLTWLELGFRVTISPWATAALALLMLAMAIVPAMYYDKKPFCRYGCLVGRVSGLYALFSPVELRSRDKAVCRTCETKDCVRGNDRGYGCPTSEYLGTMDVNTYCILCTECIKTCPYDNVALNLRPPAVDLLKAARLRPDEAYLTVAILSLATFHGVTMSAFWGDTIGVGQAWLGGGVAGGLVAFTLGMAAMLAAPGLLLLAAAWVSRRLSGTGDSLRSTAISYAFALLPVALFYHLAHNLQHLLREGQRIVPLLSDPLAWGWDLFGTASWTLGPILSLATIQYVQVGLLLIGQAFAAYVAYHVSRRLLHGRGQRLRSLAPVLMLVLGFSTVNLLLLMQPMSMRTLF